MNVCVRLVGDPRAATTAFSLPSGLHSVFPASETVDEVAAAVAADLLSPPPLQSTSDDPTRRPPPTLVLCGRRCVWVHGHAGCGKSTQADAIIARLVASLLPQHSDVCCHSGRPETTFMMAVVAACFDPVGTNGMSVTAASLTSTAAAASSSGDCILRSLLHGVRSGVERDLPGATPLLTGFPPLLSLALEAVTDRYGALHSSGTFFLPHSAFVPVATAAAARALLAAAAAAAKSVGPHHHRLFVLQAAPPADASVPVAPTAPALSMDGVAVFDLCGFASRDAVETFRYGAALASTRSFGSVAAAAAAAVNAEASAASVGRASSTGHLGEARRRAAAAVAAARGGGFATADGGIDAATSAAAVGRRGVHLSLSALERTAVGLVISSKKIKTPLAVAVVLGEAPPTPPTRTSVPSGPTRPYRRGCQSPSRSSATATHSSVCNSSFAADVSDSEGSLSSTDGSTPPHQSLLRPIPPSKGNGVPTRSSSGLTDTAGTATLPRQSAAAGRTTLFTKLAGPWLQSAGGDGRGCCWLLCVPVDESRKAAAAATLSFARRALGMVATSTETLAGVNAHATPLQHQRLPAALTNDRDTQVEAAVRRIQRWLKFVWGLRRVAETEDRGRHRVAAWEVSEREVLQLKWGDLVAAAARARVRVAERGAFRATRKVTTGVQTMPPSSAAADASTQMRPEDIALARRNAASQCTLSVVEMAALVAERDRWKAEAAALQERLGQQGAQWRYMVEKNASQRQRISALEAELTDLRAQ